MSDIWNVGSWRIDFGARRMTKRWRARSSGAAIDGRLLQVLRTLVENAGEVVTTDVLLERGWPDRVVSRDSVTTAIYQVRQLLGDNAENSKYIRSEARRGYRLVARVRAAPIYESPYAAVCAFAATVVLVVYGATHLIYADDSRTVYMEPLINYADSPVQGPLFTAVENTLLSELIQTVPGGIQVADNGAELRLQSMMVACDLGPALVVRLLDTRRETYVWSNSYNLEDAAARQEGPTLVEEVAADIGLAVAAN